MVLVLRFEEWNDGMGIPQHAYKGVQAWNIMKSHCKSRPVLSVKGIGDAPFIWQQSDLHHHLGIESLSPPKHPPPKPTYTQYKTPYYSQSYTQSRILARAEETAGRKINSCFPQSTTHRFLSTGLPTTAT